MNLSTIAHARAGDKGDTSIILAVAYGSDEYELLRTNLTTPRVSQHFGVSEEAVIVRYLPGLQACTVVISGCLDGGVTRSRGSDPHGKSLSGHLLDLSLTESSVLPAHAVSDAPEYQGGWEPVRGRPE